MPSAASDDAVDRRAQRMVERRVDPERGIAAFVGGGGTACPRARRGRDSRRSCHPAADHRRCRSSTSREPCADRPARELAGEWRAGRQAREQQRHFAVVALDQAQQPGQRLAGGFARADAQQFGEVGRQFGQPELGVGRPLAARRREHVLAAHRLLEPRSLRWPPAPAFDGQQHVVAVGLAAHPQFDIIVAPGDDRRPGDRDAELARPAARRRQAGAASAAGRPRPRLPAGAGRASCRPRPAGRCGRPGRRPGRRRPPR